MILLTSLLPERLKTIRNMRGLTQRQLAGELKVAPSTIALYETGSRRPDPEMLRKLADSLDISVDYLLGRIDAPIFVAEDNRDYLMDDLPDEARASIEEFKQYIYNKYKKK